MTIFEKYSKILHIKIPKTGTHSINKILKGVDTWNRTNFLDKKNNIKYIFDHDTFFSLKENNINQINESVFIFSICRNPYIRFFSQYEHLIRSYPTYKKSFLNFVEDVKYKNIHPIYTESQTTWLSIDGGIFSSIDLNYEEILNVYSNPKFFFSNIENLSYSNTIDKRINKIYNLENIEEFELDFSTKIPHKNYSTYSIKKYINSFEKEIKEFVINKYEEDFYNFGYDFSFEKSIIELKNKRKKTFFYR